MDSTVQASVVPSMSISLTCYNDATTISGLVDDCFEFLKERTDRYEVFVVDDGSADNSKEVLESLKKKYPLLRVHFNGKNLGFGPTFGRIYRNTAMDVNGMLPGDAQIPVEALGIMLPHLDEADLVIGYRKNRADSFRRRISSKCYNFLIQLTAGRPIKDVNSVCIYKSRIMEDVELRAVGAFIHAEFFLRLLKKGIRYKSVEIPHKRREGGGNSGGRIDVILFAAREFFLYKIGKL